MSQPNQTNDVNDDFQDYQEPENDIAMEYFINNIFNALAQNSNNAPIYYNNVNNNAFNINPYMQYAYNNYTFRQEEEQEEQEDEQYPEDYFSIFNNIFSIYTDPIDDILQQSFDQQPQTLEKTDYNLIISSQEYKTLSEEIRIDNKECSICVCEYDNLDMVSITNCNHIFHTDCIKEWGKYKQECPLCKTNLI